MKNRILIITQFYSPEPSIKGLPFALELKRLGYEVEVLTGVPNYPGGKIYPGYSMKLIQRENIGGVPITRVPLYPSHDRSSFRRFLNYASFAISAMLYGIHAAKKADFIYAFHPPLTVGFAAVLVKKIRRVPLVYDIQDIWPDSLAVTGMVNSKRILNIVDKVCHWIYDNADQIVVLSPGFKKTLVDRGVVGDKINVIYNWADEHAISENKGKLPAGYPGSDRFKILFAGNIGKAQALSSVFDAAEELGKKMPAICFILVGGGIEVQTLKSLAISKGLDNVFFYPQVPMAEIGAYLDQADVLLVHLRKDPLFKVTIPSKTQAYMNAGKPILMAVNGDAAELVSNANCGVIAESENYKSIAEAARTLYNLSDDEISSLKENSRKYYTEHLSLKQGVSAFSKLFEKMNAGHRE